MSKYKKVIKNRFLIPIILLSICILLYTYKNFSGESISINVILLNSMISISVFLSTIIADMKYYERKVVNTTKKLYLLECYLFLAIIIIVNVILFYCLGVKIDFIRWYIGFPFTIVTVLIYTLIQEVIVLYKFTNSIYLILNLIFIGVFMFVDFIFLSIPTLKSSIFTFYENTMTDLINGFFSLGDVVGLLLNSFLVLLFYFITIYLKRNRGL